MSQEGFWPITSSVDWCESNYVHSHYIAEFWNSVSSIAMIILGEAGARINPCNSFRFKLAFRLISVVGTGSFLFHGTLTSQMQALDEVPMVWTAITLLHPLIETNFGRQGIWLPITQVICAIFCTLAVTIAEGTLQFICFHISFGLLEIALLVLMSRIYFKKRASHPAVKHLFEQGVMIYALGVIVWLIDMHFCDYVNGSFLPFNPQLHAFWHIFASTGLYFLVTLILYNWYYENGTKCRIEYRYGGIVPLATIVTYSFEQNLSSTIGIRIYRYPLILYMYWLKDTYTYVRTAFPNLCFLPYKFKVTVLTVVTLLRESADL